MSRYSAERSYLMGACRAAAAFRWSTSVTVATLMRMHALGTDVPVDGDASTRWLRAPDFL